MRQRSRLSIFNQSARDIKTIARAKGLTTEQAAALVAHENRPAIEAYLTRMGIDPSHKAGELAAQVYAARNSEVEAFNSYTGAPSYSQAFTGLLRAEDSIIAKGSHPDNFLDADILGSIFEGGKNIFDSIFNPSGKTVKQLYDELKKAYPPQNNSTLLQNTLTGFAIAKAAQEKLSKDGTNASTRDMAKKYVKAYDALIPEYNTYLQTIRAGGTFTNVDTIKESNLGNIVKGAAAVIGNVLKIKIDPNKSIGDQLGEQLQADISAGAYGSEARDAYNAIVREQKKKEMEKLLPVIIIAAIALIFVVYTITKNSK